MTTEWWGKMTKNENVVNHSGVTNTEYRQITVSAFAFNKIPLPLGP